MIKHKKIRNYIFWTNSLKWIIQKNLLAQINQTAEKQFHEFCNDLELIGHFLTGSLKLNHLIEPKHWNDSDFIMQFKRDILSSYTTTCWKLKFFLENLCHYATPF